MTGSAVTWRGNVQKAILILTATLAIFFGGVSDAAEIRGRVVRIADGDTLTILSQATGTTGVPPVGEAITGTTGVPPVGGTITGTTGVSPVAQHKIRLYGIDAPESHQAFGAASKHHLSSLVFGKDVRVAYKSRDKYGRILGIVYADGRDVNLEMIRAGLAWHYKRFDSTPAYAAAENDARAARCGLWSDPNPIPPEQYRHGRAVAPRPPPTAAPVNDTWPDTGYWLSTNSNKRHNRKCENYRKTRGYPCSKSDGTPCGKCGG